MARLEGTFVPLRPQALEACTLDMHHRSQFKLWKEGYIQIPDTDCFNQRSLTLSNQMSTHSPKRSSPLLVHPFRMFHYYLFSILLTDPSVFELNSYVAGPNPTFSPLGLRVYVGCIWKSPQNQTDFALIYYNTNNHMSTKTTPPKRRYKASNVIEPSCSMSWHR